VLTVEIVDSNGNMSSVSKQFSVGDEYIDTDVSLSVEESEVHGILTVFKRLFFVPVSLFVTLLEYFYNEFLKHV
jgi:hypothetical protein